jgi:hypothetical protein
LRRKKKSKKHRGNEITKKIKIEEKRGEIDKRWRSLL